MLTIIGNSNVYNGTEYLYSINKCQIRNTLSAKLFPLKFSLKNIIVNGEQNYEYAHVLPFLHPVLSQFAVVSEFKVNDPAGALPFQIVNTHTGQVIQTASIDFGENELVIYCKTLYNQSMMIACTDNYQQTSPLKSLYTLQIPTAPLQQQNAWDVNSEGNIIYFTTGQQTYQWTIGSSIF